MGSGSLGFALGGGLILMLPDWPNGLQQLAILAVPALLGLWCRWCYWVLAGMAWTLLMIWPAHLQLPVELEGQDLQVAGYIRGLPRQDSGHQQWLLQVESLHAPGGSPVAFQGQLRLRWYGATPLDLYPGDYWVYTVRLRRPRGLLNPGGGDTERWYFANRIHARGYVREYPPPRRLATAAHASLDQWREALSQRLAERLGGNSHGSLIRALVVGDRREVDAAQQEILRRTGTSHLLAISGLHVGLVGGWCYLLVLSCWRSVPALVERCAAPRVAALAALPGALVYALMAGASLPTQRALAMILLAMLARYWMRPLGMPRLLGMALLATLLLDCLATLQAGFWLSFGAVGIITYVLVGRRPGSGDQLWWRVQWAISVALLPLGMMLFQGVSLAGPLANLVAIPWASMTVVPLSLLATLVDIDPLGDVLLDLALGSLRWLMSFLGWLAAQQWAYGYWPRPSAWGLLLALLGVMWILAPRGIPGRCLGWLLWLPMLAPAAVPAPGEIHFTLLDVGDGLAVVVRTHSHLLVVDSGGRWRGGDAAESTVVPFLRQLGIRHIDALILSHDDTLHTGGYRSLRSAFSIAQVFTPSPQHLPLAVAQACRAGQSWQWDGIVFRFLGPGETSLAGDDQSCVLQVGEALLLPGDVELVGQRRLLEGPAGSVDVLVAPHHGRRDTLLAAWLQRLDPRLVLFSTAHGNRHGYPRASTCERFASSGARLLSTADHGAITLHWSADRNWQLLTERGRRRSLWRAPALPTCGGNE